MLPDDCSSFEAEPAIGDGVMSLFCVCLALGGVFGTGDSSVAESGAALTAAGFLPTGVFLIAAGFVVFMLTPPVRGREYRLGIYEY